MWRKKERVRGCICVCGMCIMSMCVCDAARVAERESELDRLRDCAHL